MLHWKRARIFGNFFLVSVSHETKHENSSKKRGKSSAPRMTGRRSHWTERGDDNTFLRLAIVVRLFLLWLRMGLLSWDPLVWILYTQVRRSLGRKWPKQSRETKCCTHLVPTSHLVVRSPWSPKSGAKFGTKIWKIRGVFVLQLFWPNDFPKDPFVSYWKRYRDGNRSLLPPR